MQCTSQYLLTGNFDGSVRFWKMPTDKNPQTFHRSNYLNAEHHIRNIATHSYRGHKVEIGGVHNSGTPSYVGILNFK